MKRYGATWPLWAHWLTAAVGGYVSYAMVSGVARSNPDGAGVLAGLAIGALLLLATVVGVYLPAREREKHL